MKGDRADVRSEQNIRNHLKCFGKTRAYSTETIAETISISA